MSQLILFDLDGTLTESGKGITRSVQYALDKMGMKVEDPETLRCFVGPPLKEQFMEYAGFTEEQADQAVTLYRERYTTEGIFENELYPQIPELLEVLRINDKILAVASSKPEVYVRQILEHFHIDQYFQEIVGSELDGRRTDKAEVIEEVLERLQMKNERDKILMVGDKEHDVIGATSCGIRCVGVTYGYGTREELEKAGAVYIAESVEDLGILASPNDEETTERVESVRKKDRKKRHKERHKEKTKEEKTEESDADDGTDGTNRENTEKTVKRSRRKKEQNPVQEEGQPVLRPAGTGAVIYEIWRAIYPILIHWCIAMLVTIAVIFVYTWQERAKGLPVVPDRILDRVFGESLYQLIISSVLSGTLLYLLYRSDQKKRQEGFIGRGKDFVWAPPVIWFCVIVISIVAGQFLNDMIDICHLNEIFTGYSELATETMAGQPVWVLLLSVGVLAPIAEELTFRGLVFRRLKDWMPASISIVVSALAFGIYHGNVVQFLYATLFGILLAFIYHRTGTLWTCVVAHMVSNLWSLFGSAWWSQILGRIPYGTVIGILIEILLCIVPVYWLWGYRSKGRTKNE